LHGITLSVCYSTRLPHTHLLQPPPITLGGNQENPTYDEVCMGFTGHTEAVQLTYDPSEVTFGQLLNVFLDRVDPTTLNRQGACRVPCLEWDGHAGDWALQGQPAASGRLAVSCDRATAVARFALKVLQHGCSVMAWHSTSHLLRTGRLETAPVNTTHTTVSK